MVGQKWRVFYRTFHFLFIGIMNKIDDIVKQIELLFLERGKLNYGENITQTEHAMQCWLLSVNSNASLDLRVAAFLHDIGHLHLSDKENSATDEQHEVVGEELLKSWGFNKKICALVSSHVWAKRYLVTREPYYINRLSSASISSLMNQGGLMSDFELVMCEKKDYFSECIMLRRWDDEGKFDLMESAIRPDVWEDIASALQESSNN